MPVTSVLGAHWGDEGKGKVAAALSADAAMCARFQGGPNAAHTVWRPGAHEPVVLRMVPSGVVAGATGVIGRGCVVEPRMLLDEVDRLADHGIDVARSLVVSERAHVITAAHRRRDSAGSGVGSTRMGVGPAYGDKAARVGIRVGDLVAGAGLPADLAEIAGRFRHRLGTACGDETAALRRALDRGAHVVAEGAQGARLDLDHGDYPYVTSSNTTIGAVLTGLGVTPRDLGRTLVVTPAYVTKVGGGDLPSKLSGARHDELRDKGEEKDGATGLWRDVGWLDLGWLRWACALNGADGLVVTKVDVLAGTGEVGLFDGDAVSPVRLLPGWDAAAASGAAEPGPDPLRAFLAAVEAGAGVPVLGVSNGPAVDDWLLRPRLATPAPAG
jgi:adenylosuccinate synthase